MKQLDNKKKILIGIIILILVVGVVIIATKGLNFELQYQETKKVELTISKDFQVSDIKQITDEVMPNTDVKIEVVEVYRDAVKIIAKDISEEQKENLINKVNEKYGTEIKSENVEISTVSKARGRDLVKPYIDPFTIATAIILVYIGIRYFKIGTIKRMLETAGVLVLVQALYICVMAITRIPVGRVTMPIAILLYVITLICLTTNFEKKVQEIKQEKEI